MKETLFNQNLELLIDSLKLNYVEYGNICSYKLKAFKDRDYKELKKCKQCKGYHTKDECYDYISLLDLIKFYKDLK